MVKKTKKPKWKLGKAGQKALAILAAIFIPGLAIVVGTALTAVIGQEIGNSIAGVAGGQAGVLIGATIGLVTGGLTGIAYFTRKKQPPKESKPQANLTPHVTKPEPFPQPATNRETVESEHGRYVCNNNTHEIHDTKNLQPTCSFESILEKHKMKLDSLAEVEEAIKNQGYNGCRWCMTQYDTD